MKLAPCDVRAFTVAEVGGYLHRLGCYNCYHHHVRCMGSTRNAGVYVTFTDWNTMVIVDQKTKEVVAHVSEVAHPCAHQTAQDEDHDDGNADVGHNGLPVDSLDEKHDSDADTDSEDPRPAKRARVKHELSPSPSILSRSPSPPLRLRTPSPPAPRVGTGESALAEDNPFAKGFRLFHQGIDTYAADKAEWAAERERLESRIAEMERERVADRTAWEGERAAMTAQKEENAALKAENAQLKAQAEQVNQVRGAWITLQGAFGREG